MRSLADYEDYISTNFDDEIGISFSKFKNKTFGRIIPVNLDEKLSLDFEKLKQEINIVIDFVQKFHLTRRLRPLWYKINVVDQAVNEYVGIGFLNLQSDWLKFIIGYLDNDRAEEGGDTIIVIFDPDFLWAICFTLSQDNKNLSVDKFEK